MQIVSQCDKLAQGGVMEPAQHLAYSTTHREHDGSVAITCVVGRTHKMGSHAAHMSCNVP